MNTRRRLFASLRGILKHSISPLIMLVVVGMLVMGLPPRTYAQENKPSGTPTPPPSAPKRLITPGTGLRPGVMPKIRPRAAVTNAHLTYYGGHVISNVQVVQVLYGTGTYESQVQNTAAPSIASFYTGVTNSSYFDWLREYNTNITPSGGGTGTNQIIGRGTFAGQYTITPSSANNGSTIDDVNIQAELKAQIAAGHVPAPNANTYYALYFPVGKTITQGGSSSGVQFCAYHGTTTSPEVYYGVLPDFSTGGMTTGCGTGTEFQNVSSVSSHELIEAVTDAEVGIAGPIASPLAWYDSTNGEIGDICNGQQQSITGGDGRTYTVQKEWSNTQNACVVNGPAATNDFSLAVSPTSLTLAAGASGSATASTTVIAGAAGTVSLSATGQPAGVTVSFNPASVTAGGSSTISVATTTSAAAGTYAITIKGVEGTATHTASLSLTITSGGGGGGTLTNGGFETGSLSGWTTTGSASVTTTTPHSGTYTALVGSTAATNGDSSIAQTFTAPTGATGLSFWYKVVCPDTLTYDWATATLKDNTTNTTTTPLAKTCTNSSAWVQATANVTAGHSYTLTLISHDDNYAGDPTYTLYDDVALATASNDFAISASPASLSIVQGSSAGSTISTATTSGAAQTVSLSTSGLPSGATASFSPASVTSGGSSTFTIATTAATPAGSYTVTVTGTGTSATHATTIALTVTAAGGTAITNGGFETGSLSGWTAAGSASVTTGGHTGTYTARAGSTAATNGDSSIAQTFTVPAGATQLSFWYKVVCPDTLTYDWATATLKDNTANTTATILAKTCTNSGAWVQATAGVTAGHSYTLTLISHDDNYAGDATYTFYDDVVTK